MGSNKENEVKKIVADWANKNAGTISKGTNVNSPGKMLKYERTLMILLIQLGGLIMAWIIKTRIEDHDFQKTASQKIRASRTEKSKFKRYDFTKVMTLFGNVVRVRTRYYVPTDKRGRKRKSGKRGQNGSGFYPALEILGIKNGVTPAIACDIAREVTEGPSMEAARERFDRRGISLNIKTIKRISETFAKISLDIREEWLKTGGQCKTPLIPSGESLKGMNVLIGIDGGKMRTRKKKRGRIPEGKRMQGYDTNWCEPRLIVIRAIDDIGKVIREIPPIYDGTIDTADPCFALLEAHLRARDIHLAKKIVCACDGADWIWNRMENMLKGLGANLSKVSYVVDFFHDFEHIVEVANGRRGWNQRQRERWLKKMKALLIQGEIERIIEELNKLARGRNASTVKGEIGYFEKHKERMRYDILRSKNLPIGSGAVESAIRQVINMRLKGVGTFWLKKNAEGFLHLRCYLKAGRWDLMENAVINHKKYLG